MVTDLNPLHQVFLVFCFLFLDIEKQSAEIQDNKKESEN